MKQFTVVCCLLSLFVPSIGTAAPCLNSAENCAGVECTEEKHKTTIYMQRDILASLYGLPKETVLGETRYDYNYYGCSCDFGLNANMKEVNCVYKGGHAGWDVRTLYNRDPTLREHEFYCITPGIVLANGRRKDGTLPDCENNNRAIVIYDENTGYATHYLHASDVSLSLQVGEFIGFGEYLGLQGDCGLTEAEHIHIETRTLARCGPGTPYKHLTIEMINQLVESSYGTKDTVRPTRDPIQYLYDSVKSQEHIKSCTLPEIWGRCKMMHQSY